MQPAAVALARALGAGRLFLWRRRGAVILGQRIFVGGLDGTLLAFDDPDAQSAPQAGH